MKESDGLRHDGIEEDRDEEQNAIETTSSHKMFTIGWRYIAAETVVVVGL